MRVKSLLSLLAIGLSSMAMAEVSAVQGIRISFSDDVPSANIAFGTNPAISHDASGNILLGADGMEKQTYSAQDVVLLEHLLDVSGSFPISAGKGVNGDDKYYSTFYSSKWAYKVPDGVSAYIGTVEGSAIRFVEIEDGTIPAGVAVLLVSEEDSYNLAACDCVGATDMGDLSGTDVAIPELETPDNCYILSATTKLGMGFYPLLSGLAANKSYLVLAESQPKALTISIDGDVITGVPVTEGWHIDNVFNLQGMEVDDSYEGVIIINGEKTYR